MDQSHSYPTFLQVLQQGVHTLLEFSIISYLLFSCLADFSVRVVLGAIALVHS
jgi:hypothetical protein